MISQRLPHWIPSQRRVGFPYGSEAIGSEAIGSEAIGSEAIGSEAIGSEAIGSEAMWCPRASTTACMSMPRTAGERFRA